MNHDFEAQAAFGQCIYRTRATNFPEENIYRGKVRDVYRISDEKLAIVTTDRISAFDHILPAPIPYKGQILNTIATYFLEQVSDIIPTHLISVPHPNITIAKNCRVIPIEVVVRGYLTGHAWRVYKSGKRELCGVELPEGMSEHQAFPNPIITPATKAAEGHDEDISESEILQRNIISTSLWEDIKKTAFLLFARGSEIARKRGLILVDTKYEFGLYNGQLTLIDEVHTPDSSRYFYEEGYQARLKAGKAQKQLSKEFVREWLMSNNFQGLEGQVMPEMNDEFRLHVYERYAELCRHLTGKDFIPTPHPNFDDTLTEILKKEMKQ